MIRNKIDLRDSFGKRRAVSYKAVMCSLPQCSRPSLFSVFILTGTLFAFYQVLKGKFLMPSRGKTGREHVF